MNIEDNYQYVDIPINCDVENQESPTDKSSSRNTIESCISAVTVDSSILSLQSSHIPPRTCVDSLKSIEEKSKDGLDTFPSPDFSEPLNGMPSAFDKNKDMSESPFVKGSLYSRIMNGFQEVSMVDRVVAKTEQDKLPGSSIPDQKQDFSIGTDEDSIVEDIVFDEEKSILTCEDQVNMSKASGEEDNGISESEINRSSAYEGNIASQMNITISKKEFRYEKKQQRMDQWREVLNSHTGKRYYYNRRTRESRWTLPSDGILLSRKRHIQGEQDCSIPSLCCSRQVSISAITDEDQSSCNELGSCEQSNILRNLDRTSVSHSIGRNEELHSTGRKAFHPEDTNQTNGTRSNELNINDTQHNSIACTGFADPRGGKKRPLFCMYCGTSLHRVNEMQHHLHFECSRYKDFKLNNYLEHEELKSAIRNVWSDLGGDKENKPPNFVRSSVKPNPEKHFGSSLATSLKNCNAKNSQISYGSSDIFSVSDDENTIIDNNVRRRYQKSFEEDSESIVSSCAFCDKRFRSGFLLSKHFLVCKKRQKSSRKRTLSSSMTSFCEDNQHT